MTLHNNKAYLRLQDIKPAEARRVLAFLNTVRTAGEIVDAVKLVGGRDVGIKVAQNVLNRRAQLGGFTDLKQVISVSQVGTERFTKIIAGLGKILANDQQVFLDLINGRIGIIQEYGTAGKKSICLLQG